MLLDIRPDHLEIVRDILRRHVSQYAVWAFGSRVKWTAKDYSDLDLCIRSDTPLDFRVLGALAEDFSESDLPYKVDLVDWATTSEPFRKIIEQDKVVIHQQSLVSGANSVWKESTLGEFVRLQRGHDLTASEQKAGAVPVMGSAGQNGTHNVAKASGPGVVIGRSGASMGRVHCSDVDFWPHNTCLYVTDFLGNNPRFAYYVLQTLDLAAYNSGSAQPSLNRNFIYSMRLRVPPRSEQDHIVEVLKALDDRIALLRETNATLEGIAQALFKSWFVDFDPVRAKQEGREPEVMDAATAALFPDSFEESELGLVPKGWSCGKVEDLLELAYGKALKASDRTDGPVPVYGSGGITGWHNASLVVGPSIIVGRKGTVGSLYWEDRPFYPIDTVFYVKTSEPMTFCYYLLKTLGLEKMNTDGAVPGLNRGNAYRLQVVIPPTKLLNAFDVIASTLRARIFLNEKQAGALVAIRDTLLPRLISGQLRLPDFEPA